MNPVSVSQINGYVKRVLQTDPLLGNVAVIGEIANIKYHSTGHVYFSLKDESSKLSCFLPASVAAHVRYALEDGMEITAYGYVGVFERGGMYSLNIRDIEVKGVGNLAQAFQALKEKLEREGLFDPKYKKPIPSFPKKIAIVTSPTGAAVRDLIKVLRDRNPFVDLYVYPVLVQGPGAAPEIAAAISDINDKFPDTDLIITGRGGGSQEELWAFNEETVSRSIFLSKIPVISAVGHETDFSISDFVADVRAATPTEAAVISTENISAMAERAKELKTLLFRSGLTERLSLFEMRLRNAEYNLRNGAEDGLQRRKNALERLITELRALSPDSVLSRGYAAILDSSGFAVSSVAGRKAGDGLTVLLKDGKLQVTVNDILSEETEQ